MWVPAHIGVKANELADKCAQQVTQKEGIDFENSHSKAKIKSMVKAKASKWLNLWRTKNTARH